MELRNVSFVVVDVETTGLSSAHHRITDIALVRVERGKIVESFETLVNPEQYIPSFIAEYTGITNAMVYNAPTFREALPKIQAFLNAVPDSVLVGHNVKFDHGFLEQSFRRSGMPFVLSTAVGSTHMLCTCRLARRMVPKLSKKTLKSLQDHFGIRNKRQHRAMGDAEATAKVLIEFLKLASDFDLETLEDILSFQHRRAGATKKPTKKQVTLRDKVKAFPERPGVYTMTDRMGSILYVGKAKSLRDRVSSYFSDANTRGTKLAKMMRTVKDINFEETGSELSALLLESRKIKELRPRFNSMERRYRTYTFLRLDVQNPFPRLTIVREPEQDGSEYFGPFRSWDTVSALVDVLNRSFKLRECGDDFQVSDTNQPCFYYDIKRCTAPCARRVESIEYRSEVNRLREFLAAGEKGVLAQVECMMFKAAEALDFEEAQFLKTRLLELRRVLGTGERMLASLNSNDFVILIRTPTGECEVLFVRWGRLAKQIVLNHAHLEKAEEWFFKQLRIYYGAVSALPPTLGKSEIDEMRILSHWCEQKRKKGNTIVYLGANWEESVSRLVRELRIVLGPLPAVTSTLKLPEMVVPPTPSKRGKRLVLKKMS